MTSKHKKINIFWFRRDLRLTDNAGLHAALSAGHPVLPIFIFDREILDELDDPQDRRVEFIHHAISEINATLKTAGSTLLVKHGKPPDVFRELIQTYGIEGVYTNRDYEPYARKRDGKVQGILKEGGIAFKTFKDQVIFEKSEVLTAQDTPYTVFTPYSRTWKSKLSESDVAEKPSASLFSNFLQCNPLPLPSLSDLGFSGTGEPFPSKGVRDGLIANYDQTRNFPAKDGTTRLSVHLRFGTISIRALVRRALQLNETWLDELIWREFFMQILWHFPKVVDQPFKEKYAAIQWRNNETEFRRWCEGKTGYPMVDAGMRELNATGFMHNRVRMVVASFLTKHLLIDWRWGERYFAKKLLDYDLSANNGNWQWAAGCGCDAAPYFRIFNPASQLEKFDPEYKYVKKWVPELDTNDYPAPIVEHKFARERCLSVYKAAVG